MASKGFPFRNFNLHGERNSSSWNNHSTLPRREIDDRRWFNNKSSSNYIHKDDVLRASAIEREYLRKELEIPILLLRFPDPELSPDIVKNFSSEIDTVHFQQCCSPRYCYVNLKPNSDITATIESLSKIRFGTGFISAEIKRAPQTSDDDVEAENLDPYTLYVGNLPRTIAVKKVKEYFPGAKRVEMGYGKQMKNTRYCFVRYESVDIAVEAFKRLIHTVIDSRTLIVRFKRLRSMEPHNAEHSNADQTPTTHQKNTNNTTKRNITDSCENKKRHHGNTEVITAQSVLPIRIKEEAQAESLIDKDPPQLQINKVTIKTEPPDDMSVEDFEYNARLNRTVDNFSPPPVLANITTTKISELEDIKPDIKSLATPYSETGNTDKFSLREHKSFVRKLRTTAKKTDGSKRLRDELDDIFDQLNSDSDDD